MTRGRSFLSVAVALALIYPVSRSKSRTTARSGIRADELHKSQAPGQGSTGDSSLPTRMRGWLRVPQEGTFANGWVAPAGAVIGTGTPPQFVLPFPAAGLAAAPRRTVGLYLAPSIHRHPLTLSHLILTCYAKRHPLCQHLSGAGQPLPECRGRQIQNFGCLLGSKPCAGYQQEAFAIGERQLHERDLQATLRFISG